MTVAHPIEARHGRDLPPGYLADRLRASLLQAPGRTDYGANLLERIDRVRDADRLRSLLTISLESFRSAAKLLAEVKKATLDAAFLDHWEQEAGALLNREIARESFDPARPLRIVARSGIAGLAHSLAALPLVRAKLERRDVPIRLAAEPRTRLPPGAPDDIATVEVVDFAESKRPRASGPHRSLHGSETPMALYAEAIAMVAPEKFSDAVERLRGANVTVPALYARLEGLGLPADRFTACIESGVAGAGVTADLTMATCCGIPAWRPLVTRGREVEYGPARWSVPQQAKLAASTSMRFANVDEAICGAGYLRAPFSSAANGDPERPLLALWNHDSGAAAACWTDPASKRMLLGVDDGALADALVARRVATSL